MADAELLDDKDSHLKLEKFTRKRVKSGKD